VGPIRNVDIRDKAPLFDNAPVIYRIHSYDLKKVYTDDLYYGLFDGPIIIGLLVLEKYSDALFQVRLIQIEEKCKGQGYRIFLYDYVVMNDKLSILSDSRQSEGGLGGSKGLWSQLYRQGRYKVCGYDLNSDTILPDVTPSDVTPSDVYTQTERIVWLARPNGETIDEMLYRYNSSNRHRIFEFYGPNVIQSNQL